MGSARNAFFRKLIRVYRSNDTFAWVRMQCGFCLANKANSHSAVMMQLMQLAFQTVALTTLFVSAAAILAVATFNDKSSSVYYALQYPIPSLCKWAQHTYGPCVA